MAYVWHVGDNDIASSEPPISLDVIKYKAMIEI